MDSITVSRHKHSRFWAVRSPDGKLICVCVYKRGALEVARLLEECLSAGVQDTQVLRETPPVSDPPRQ